MKLRDRIQRMWNNSGRFKRPDQREMTVEDLIGHAGKELPDYPIANLQLWEELLLEISIKYKQD